MPQPLVALLGRDGGAGWDMVEHRMTPIDCTDRLQRRTEGSMVQALHADLNVDDVLGSETRNGR